MTLRKLRVLVENLSPGCALVRAAHGTEWATVHYMLADIYDAINHVSRTIAGTVTPKGKTVPKIDRYPRPVIADPQPAESDHLDQSNVLALLQSLKPPAATGEEDTHA